MAATKSRPWGNVKPPAGSTVNWGDAISKGMIHCYLMNEAGIAILLDIVNSKHCAVDSSVSTGAGKFGTARFTTATANAITVNVPNYIGIANALSVSMWINNTLGEDASVDRSVFNDTGNSIRLTYHDRAGFAPAIQWGVRVGFGGPSVQTVTTVQNTWTHICVSYKTEDMRLSVNGILLASGTTAFTLPSTTSSMQIGKGWTGGIDNIRVYNRSLSQNEHIRLYTEPFAGIDAPRIRIRSGTAAPPAGPHIYGLFKPVVLRASR